jgi:hypothetical protein
MSLLVSCGDPAHDAATWAGAPWGLEDADLPDDQPVVVDLHGLVCTPGCEVVLDDCAMSCTTTEVLRAAAETYDALFVSIEPGAKVILVAAAIDIHSESGYEDELIGSRMADPSWLTTPRTPSRPGRG